MRELFDEVAGHSPLDPGEAVRRTSRVPLRKRMGTGWDVAYAALFLASDEANFITGIGLLVDGGGSLRKE